MDEEADDCGGTKAADGGATEHRNVCGVFGFIMLEVRRWGQEDVILMLTRLYRVRSKNINKRQT